MGEEEAFADVGIEVDIEGSDKRKGGEKLSGVGEKRFGRCCGF